MKRTRIKICGIREPDTAWVAAQMGADAVGLVFAEGSPRQVSVADAKAIVAVLPAFVQPIALFVNADAEQIRSTCHELGIGTVQLHGEETPEDAAALWPLRVIKAMAFDARSVSAALRPWRGSCENLTGILFDTPPPTLSPASSQTNGGDDIGASNSPIALNKTTNKDADSERLAPRGGTGRPFDWDALASVQHAGLLAGLPPTILAGGLNPDNVGRAIERVNPYAVDVSSGVESSRGVKDATLIESFCKQVGEAETRYSPAL